jgi:hypothetical protein
VGRLPGDGLDFAVIDLRKGSAKGRNGLNSSSQEPSGHAGRRDDVSRQSAGDLTQPKKRKDGDDDNDSAYDVNDVVHETLHG